MPSRNSVFEKALALLAHPLSLGALALLLVNDHLLRPLWPSWWTGKLGDLAWLFFTPFVLAALLAWVVPSRREKWIFGLAFSLTGTGFALVKLLPEAQTAAGQVFTTLTGAAPSLVRDPSDLLALFGLAGAAALWHTSTTVQPRLSARGLVTLPLAALLILADAAAPDPGITCFSQQYGKIYASAGYTSYLSQDGGLTWDAGQPGTNLECSRDPVLADGWQEIPGPRENVLYRYRANAEIQRSTDGGQTWQPGIQLEPITEAESMFYVKSRSGNPFYQPGPLDAVADLESGNMLFAMGHQGVLVHTAQGEWQWSIGSEYEHLQDFPNGDAFALLLSGMAYLAVELALILYSAMALRWTFHWLRLVILIIAALGWLVTAIIFPPAYTTGYAETITVLGILAVGLLALPLAIEQTLRLVHRAPRAIPALIGLALAGGLLYFLPYLLWLYSTLPTFNQATFFGLALAAAALLAGVIYVRRLKKTPA